MASITMLDSTMEADKLTFEIFSILENKFLFGGAGEKTETKQSTVVNNKISFGTGKNATGKVRILSIDGGGATDGLLAAKSLCHLEASLRTKSGNAKASISDYFDVAAGSGVGGVLAALLFTRGKSGSPICTAEEALTFIADNRKKISRPSSSGILRRVLKPEAGKLFGKLFGDAMMKDTLKAVLIPCYDLATGAPFVFSRADALEIDGYDFAMKDVCAATSAVTAVELRSVDKKSKIAAVGGGIVMNNPTATAITHVLNNKQEFPFCNGVEDLLVVSLGNGESSFGPGKSTATPAREFARIAGEGVSDMVDQAVSMAFGESGAGNYVRIQANGTVSGQKSTETLLRQSEEMLAQKNVESVLFQGKKLAKSTNLDKLKLFSDELIKEHERRKTSILPTVVLKQGSSSSPRTSSATTLSSISSN